MDGYSVSRRSDDPYDDSAALDLQVDPPMACRSDMAKGLILCLLLSGCANDCAIVYTQLECRW